MSDRACFMRDPVHGAAEPATRSNRIEFFDRKFAVRNVVVHRKRHLVSPVDAAGHSATARRMPMRRRARRDDGHVVVISSVYVAGVLMSAPPEHEFLLWRERPR